MCICNDLRWPDRYRVLALRVCQVVTFAYNTPKHYPLALEHAHLIEFRNDLCMQAGAYANGLWVIAFAKADLEDNCQLFGRRRIISPKVDIVAEATTTEDKPVIVQIDLESCRLLKENILNFDLHREPEE